MEWNNYSENKQSPATAPVQQIWSPTENTMNAHGFGSPANPQLQHCPTQPQNQNQHQVQYQYSTQPQIQPQVQPQLQESQPMVILQTGQNCNTNSNWNSAPVHRREIQSSFVLHLVTLGVIVTKLIHALSLFGVVIYLWVYVASFFEKRNPPPGQGYIEKDDTRRTDNISRGFIGMLLGFSIVNIVAICAALFGAAKKMLCLVLFWIVLLCIDILFQIFLLGISSLVLSFVAEDPEFSRAWSKYLISSIVQSVLTIIFDVAFLICAFLFCKQINLKKSRRRQAKVEARQGQRAIYSS